MDIADDTEREAEQAIPPEAFVAYVIQSNNIAAELDDAKLTEIAQQVIADYDMDRESMSDWLERMERGLKLAKLLKDDKNYPFDGAANVKYPLVTSAALQFNARAYPAIVSADRIVSARVWGSDKGGKKAAKADRVSEYMSWQLASQIEEWEEETDKLLVQLPIAGTMVRKWWYDPAAERARCRLLDPGKFIVNDKVKNLADAPRVSEDLPLYPSEIASRIRSGQYVQFEWDETGEDSQAAQDFIEQHTRLDLDEDGYGEPYVVTVHRDTQKVVRIVADFTDSDVTYQRETQDVAQPVQMLDPMTGAPIVMEQIVQQEVITGILGIRRGSYFVAHQFMPSMDGGFHGTGLGLLLGDISESINTIINMMLDAGHYASLGGGWIGSDFRMKGGAQRHRPGEYKMVPTSGMDIRAAVVDRTFPGPDGTLFQMLGLLIDAGREVASVKDVMTGDTPNGQQTATATLALIDQGMMVFTAAYKRIFRALKKEYALLARINRDYLSAEEYAAFHDDEPEQPQQQDPAVMQPNPMMGDNGGPPLDPAQEFDMSNMDIQPVADPRSVTKMQQAAKAQLIMQLVEMGLVDKGAGLARVAEAMDIEDVDELAPKPDPMAQQMQQMQMQGAQAELIEKSAKIQLLQAQVEETRAKTIKALSEAENDEARVNIEQSKLKMDALKALLEDERGRLEAVIRGVGGMAGKPGNGNAAGGNGQANPTTQVLDAAGLYGGQSGAGGGSFGPLGGGGMG